MVKSEGQQVSFATRKRTLLVARSAALNRVGVLRGFEPRPASVHSGEHDASNDVAEGGFG